MLPKLDYYLRDVVAAAFGIHLLQLALFGKASYLSSAPGIPPKIRAAKVQSMWGRYVCAAIAACLLALVVWDLSRKLWPRG